MSEKSSDCGSNLAILLVVTFVILKLTGVIDWSWFWVFSPVILPLAFWFLFILAAGIVYHLITKK